MPSAPSISGVNTPSTGILNSQMLAVPSRRPHPRAYGWGCRVVEKAQLQPQLEFLVADSLLVCLCFHCTGGRAVSSSLSLSDFGASLQAFCGVKLNSPMLSLSYVSAPRERGPGRDFGEPAICHLPK